MSLAVPLLLLYEGSIMAVQIVEKKKRGRADAAAAARRQRQAGGVGIIFRGWTW